MTFDWTINVGNVTAIGAVLIACGKLYIQQRDEQRDIRRIVGKEDPPTGLVRKSLDLESKQAEHREWLLRAGLDRRHHDRREES